MRTVLGFDGTARELLTDLAADGGAVLFVDNLDFFEDEERRIVVDLVREAAGIPGFAVIATARRNFGVEEPNWLPSDALDHLGRAEPIMIDELSDAEVDEIRHAAPGLAPLLADTHPARDVTRNLFRLARLVTRPKDAMVLRTEADMAEQWWQTADGKLDGDHRDRARLLRVLAEVALSHAGPLDASIHPAEAVDALVTSETLRDLRNDRVAFRHDVLREWAIGNLLHSDPTMIERLPLTRLASAALAMGVELAARLALELAVDSTRWQSLVERLSREGTHGSWRRAALLALVRSEIASELLTRASTILLANRAGILCELIRIVMAVDVEPALKWFGAFGVDPATIPPSINVPNGPSCYRLIVWLLSLGQSLPVTAIPDVVDLYIMWPIRMRGLDSLTPSLLQWQYRWLIEIETTRDTKTFGDRRKSFGGELDHEQAALLESDLRVGFLLFCHRTPALAKEYLQSLSHRRRSDVVRSILKIHGSLAQAAPEELAELTATALIPNHQPADHRHDLEEPFDFLDHEFLPASPTQGPFLELLMHAPQYGLSLIHRLVDHAISFYSGGSEYGADAITISFPDGDRAFPWRRSYAWSREGSGHYSVTSALMALEAWAHRRIEAGQTFEAVIAEVLDQPDLPAAYLLVVVDLLLSHWPKSRETAVPFLACPQLLCIDRERHVPDRFGFNLRKPVAGLEGLAPSRQFSLEDLLGKYAVFESAEVRETLTAMLRRSSARLGPPDPQSNLRDPAFMAVAALNRVDPNNWRESSISLPDGTQQTAFQYVSPEAEARHLAALQEATQDLHSDTNMQAALSLALEDPSRSSPELVAAAVQWAQRAVGTSEQEDGDEDGDWMREQALVSAAMIAMRDGDGELRVRHGAWARGVFAQAMQTKDNPVYRSRSGLQYNPVAIAFVGMIHLLKDRAATGDVQALLAVASRDDPAAAHGFGAAATALASIDERLPRAVLRCAFAACIRPSHEWNLPEEEVTARSERHRQQVRVAMDAELAWLADESPEPEWSTFPSEAPRHRRRLRLPGGRGQQDTPAPQRARQDEYADHQAAALWLSKTKSLVDIGQRSWIRKIAQSYASWTAAANGTGMDMHEEVANPPSEWNDAYFDLLAHCLPGLALPEIEQLALTPIGVLPDKAFYDIIIGFLRSVDAVYFSDRGLQEPIAIRIRSVLANRMMATSGWQHLAGNRSSSIERHIGPAIAVLFFNVYGFAAPAQCYLLPNGIDRLDAFLPVLEQLIEHGPSLFVAFVTLNLLEVSPRSAHLPFLVTAAKAWLRGYPDHRDFWVDYGIGRRVCVWIEEVRRQEPTLFDRNEAMRMDVDRLLAKLITLGVAEASRLETALARGSGSGA